MVRGGAVMIGPGSAKSGIAFANDSLYARAATFDYTSGSLTAGRFVSVSVERAAPSAASLAHQNLFAARNAIKNKSRSARRDPEKGRGGQSALRPIGGYRRRESDLPAAPRSRRALPYRTFFAVVGKDILLDYRTRLGGGAPTMVRGREDHVPAVGRTAEFHVLACTLCKEEVFRRR